MGCEVKDEGRIWRGGYGDGLADKRTEFPFIARPMFVATPSSFSRSNLRAPGGERVGYRAIAECRSFRWNARHGAAADHSRRQCAFRLQAVLKDVLQKDEESTKWLRGSRSEIM
jgi:hypothetical protein